MPVLISLLRGVNVGGHHKVKMDDLRAIYESLGCEDVQTFINSGNVIFKTAATRSSAPAQADRRRHRERLAAFART
jgi:uncharacterized protein (DUF1697 family)